MAGDPVTASGEMSSKPKMLTALPILGAIVIGIGVMIGSIRPSRALGHLVAVASIPILFEILFSFISGHYVGLSMIKKLAVLVAAPVAAAFIALCCLLPAPVAAGVIADFVYRLVKLVACAPFWILARLLRRPSKTAAATNQVYER